MVCRSTSASAIGVPLRWQPSPSSRTKHSPPIFKSAFELFCDEGESTHHCLSMLREAIHRGIDQAPATDGANAAQRLTQRLREILIFHPGGGQTYANLWEQAYKMLCAPILSRLDRDGLDSALDLSAGPSSAISTLMTTCTLGSRTYPTT